MTTAGLKQVPVDWADCGVMSTCTRHPKASKQVVACDSTIPVEL